jgi:Methyltransferase domain
MTRRRVLAAVGRRLQMLRHRGDAVRCPICESGFDRFKDDWNRSNALCWRCGSHERHRALWLYLERHPELLESASSLLHFAPEWCLEHRLRRLRGTRYATADLQAAAAELQLDITALDLPDESFDAILCSHVLEHVQDDRSAIRELHRVLSPDGWAIVMVPIDLSRSETYEDPLVSTPQAREREFWQSDHVRLYAPDIAERLRDAGFEVAAQSVARELGPELAARYRLLGADEVFLCRKRREADILGRCRSTSRQRR